MYVFIKQELYKKIRRIRINSSENKSLKQNKF